jgi:SSS family solute:Na+ symporter
MSTASGLFIGTSTVFTNDVLRPRRGGRTVGVGANRLALFVVGAVALGISFAVDSVVGAITLAADLLAAGLLVPVLGAIFWRRSSTPGAIAGIVGGSLVCVYGMLASLVLFVGVTLCTTPAHDVDFEQLPPDEAEQTAVTSTGRSTIG